MRRPVSRILGRGVESRERWEVPEALKTLRRGGLFLHLGASLDGVVGCGVLHPGSSSSAAQNRAVSAKASTGSRTIASLA